MQDINYYIKTTYKDDPLWFTREINKPHHTMRIAKCFKFKNYLHGKHEVLNRQDTVYKNKKFTVRKIVLHNTKTILNFHSNYLLGKPTTLTGTEDLVKEIQSVYNYGNYNSIDWELMDKMGKYGDSFEFIYVDDNGNITSKVFDSACSYPVFADDGTYIAFIEYWTNKENISYWNVYYPDRVDEWNNEGSDPYSKPDKTTGKDVVYYDPHMIDSTVHDTGLPIHYYNPNDWDFREGEGLLELIQPIMDELEDIYSKFGDSIYTLSLNPLLVSTGQPLKGSVNNNDSVGYMFNMELGSDLKYIASTMDANSIKLYLTEMQNQLNFNAYMPSILGGNTNIANVSEVSLRMLYQLADVFAMLNERVMRNGFNERFNVIRKLLGRNNKGEYVNVEFNYARPQNVTETLDNIQKQVTMGAMSIETAVEKSPLTPDKTQELERLKKDNKGKTDNSNIDTNIVNNDTVTQ